MSKTLLLTDVFPPRIGGSGRYLWEIYSRLPREEVAIVAGETPGHEAFDRTHDLQLRRMPLAFPTWGVASPAGLRSYGRTWNRLRKLLRAESIGRVHAGKCLPEGWLAWMLKRTHGLPYACYVYGEEMNLATGSRELSWLTRRVVHGAEFLVAISRNTETILRDEWHLPPEQLRLLHPGVDTRLFVPAVRDAAVRHRLGWGDRPVLLSVGRLQKRKGQDQVILALPAVRRHLHDILFAVVGDGEERLHLEALAAREGLSAHVQFLGELELDTLRHCYQQCDLFVLANREVGRDIEGFGIVLLEAQACGKPVVAGMSGGTAETMRIPDTGEVVDCTGPEALAATLIRLLTDPDRRRRMGSAARQWVVDRFDWEIVGRQAPSLLDWNLPPRTGADQEQPAISGVP